MVSPGRKLARGKIVAKVDIYKFMIDFVHHNSSELVAPVLQSVPSKCINHQGNTIIVTVPIHNISALDHFNRVNV